MYKVHQLFLFPGMKAKGKRKKGKGSNRKASDNEAGRDSSFRHDER